MEYMEPKHGDKCKKTRCGCSQKSLLGIILILAGVLVIFCFVPGWMIALVAAFILFAVGAMLLGTR